MTTSEQLTEDDRIKTTLHESLWREGFRPSERLEGCTGQDARAVAEMLTPVVSLLVAEGVRDAARDWFEGNGSREADQIDKRWFMHRALRIEEQGRICNSVGQEAQR